MQSVSELGDLKSKTVLVRADFNVPIEDGKVVDDFRIKKTIPTLELLHKAGARIIIISHAGEDGSQTLMPVAEALNALLPTVFISKTVLTKEEVVALPENGIFLLENIRREAGEKENSIELAQQLAAMADIYVNEAFPVSHREHASIVGVPKLLPHYAGLQLEEEVNNLKNVLENPEHPFLFMLGGAKFSTKLPLIEKFLETADHVFIAGALANNFLKLKGVDVGTSLVEEGDFGLEKMLDNPKLILPIDTEKKDNAIMDIGPETVKILEPIIASAKLILWNGPTGKYEDGFDKQTIVLLKLLAASSAKTIIGGGDTVALVSKLNMEKDFTFVSTGGGATLEFLAQGTLVGIEALG